MQTAPARPARLAFLDGLRLVAALYVASYHYIASWRIDGHSLPTVFWPHVAYAASYGYLGVELFFLISGFVIGMSGWGARLGEFFVSRVSRLYPAYWICAVITAIVVLFLPIEGGVPVTGHPDAGDFTINMTMLQQPFGVASIDTVYWTLFVELRFYLLFALLVWRGLDRRRVILFCVGWMTVAMLVPATGSATLALIFVPEYAPYFVAGLALYLIYRFGPTPLLYGIVGFCWLVSMHLVTDRMEHQYPGFPLPKWPGMLFITVAYLIMLAVALGWTDRIRWRWLTVAGALTYPFYLLHQRIGYTAMRLAWEHTHLSPHLLVAATITVMLAVAYLVHRAVERPFGRFMRRTLRREIVVLQRPALPAPRPRPVLDHTVRLEDFKKTEEPTAVR